MALEKYSRLVTDTANNVVAPTKLTEEITTSSIVTQLDNITRDNTVLDIFFKAILSETDETTLDSLIAAHQGVEDPSPNHIQKFPEGSFETRKYVAVPANDTAKLDFILGDGKTLSLFDFGGDVDPNATMHMTITWDPVGTPEILFITYGSNTQATLKELIGDGVKILRIKLFNNTSATAILGGYWIGKEK